MFAGITPHTDSSRMTQIARNISDVSNGFFCRKGYLILAHCRNAYIRTG
jgi:hypothetical protein